MAVLQLTEPAPTVLRPHLATGAVAVGMAVAASAVAGGIHLGASTEHLEAWPLAGRFLVGAGAAQVACAAAIASGASRRVAGVAALVNGALLALWLVSRTVGVPFGPHAGQPETIAAADLCAAAAAAVAAALFWSVATGASRSTPLPPVGQRTFVLAAVAAVALAWSTQLGVLPQHSHALDAGGGGYVVQPGDEPVHPPSDVGGQHDHGGAHGH
jgi:hypothetical protein